MTTKTIQYYNQNGDYFINDTVEIEFSNMQKMFLKYLKPKATILDVGCGSGRDAKAFQSKGYNVTAIDGSEAMCQYASKLLGNEVQCLQFKDITYKHEFDGIWASASLLHVPQDALLSVIKKLTVALKDGGYLYMSFKYGTFEGERNSRHFTDLNEDTLSTLIHGISELTLIEKNISSDIRKGREHEKWLNVIVKKKS